MEPINLDNTKALNRIADALEAINMTLKMKGGLEALTAGLALMINKPGALGGEAEHFVKDSIRGTIEAMRKNHEEETAEEGETNE